MASSVGIIANHKNVILGLQVDIDADLTSAHYDEIIIFKERVVGDAGRPDYGVAADRLATDRQLIGCLALHCLAQVKTNTQLSQSAPDDAGGFFGQAWQQPWQGLYEVNMDFTIANAMIFHNLLQVAWQRACQLNAGWPGTDQWTNHKTVPAGRSVAMRAYPAGRTPDVPPEVPPAADRD